MNADKIRLKDEETLNQFKDFCRKNKINAVIALEMT